MTNQHHRTLLAMTTLFALIAATGMSVRGEPEAKPSSVAPNHYIVRKSSPVSLQGKAAFQREHCTSCHSIALKGGCLAPPLDGIGAHRSPDFILSRISDKPAEIELFHRLHPGGELLEHPRLNADKARLITDYLLTLPEPAQGFSIGKHEGKSANAEKSDTANEKITSAADVKRGREVFLAHSCLSCHSVNGLGGHFAPQLDGEFKRRDRAFVEERITDAQFFTQKFPDEYGERGLVMPPTDLTKAEIKQVTDFIMSLPDKADATSN